MPLTNQKIESSQIKAVVYVFVVPLILTVATQTYYLFLHGGL